MWSALKEFDLDDVRWLITLGAAVGIAYHADAIATLSDRQAQTAARVLELEVSALPRLGPSVEPTDPPRTDSRLDPSVVLSVAEMPCMSAPAAIGRAVAWANSNCNRVIANYDW